MFGQRDLAVDRRGGHIWSPCHVGYVNVRDSFGPYRLPDPSRPFVPDPVRFLAPVLLAARLLRIGRLVLCPHDDRMVVRVRGHRIGDVGGERGLPADMTADELSVEPHLGAEVDGPEVDQDPLLSVPATRQRFSRDPAAIPDDRMYSAVTDQGRG